MVVLVVVVMMVVMEVVVLVVVVMVVVAVPVVYLYTILSWTGPACGGGPQLSAGWREENKW